MLSKKEVIEKYRQVDSEQRLSFFLDCPALRGEFVQIEFDEYKRSQAFSQIPAGKATSPYRKIFDWNFRMVRNLKAFLGAS